MIEVTDRGIAGAVERFFRQPDILANMEFLSRRLPGEADLFVAGGALRNLIIDVLHGKAPPTRDVDLFIGGLARGSDLFALLADQPVKPTDLKGLRWRPRASAMAYDLCLLPDFLVIETYHLDPTLDNLLAGIDFTANAIVYDYRRKRLVEKGAIAAVQDRIIDFNCRLIPDKGLITYRILLIAHKTGFGLSESAWTFITQQVNVETLSVVERLFRKKLGKAMAAVLMDDYDRLCRSPRTGAPTSI